MNRLNKRQLQIATRGAVGTSCLILAAVIYTLLVRTAPQVEITQTSAAARQIAVLPAKKISVKRQWHGFGTAAAITSADVPARITALVVEIPDYVLVGATVKKGQLLVALDDRDYRREVEIAERNLIDLEAQMTMLEIQHEKLVFQIDLESQDLELARNERDRIQKLLTRGAASHRDFDLAKRTVIAVQITLLRTTQTLEQLAPSRQQLDAQYQAQQATLSIKELNLARCRITSPIDGVLQTVEIEVGEYLMSGDRVARVVNLERIEVALKLPASSRLRLSVGNQVQLRATNQSGLVWNTRVARIAPEDDLSTRTVTTYIELDQRVELTRGLNPSGKTPIMMMPGMFVSGVVTTGQAQKRWVVPRRSVQDNRLLVVANGVVQVRPVQVDFVLEQKLPLLGLPDDQWAILADDLDVLHDGSLVVINASTSVRPGQSVVPTILTTAAAPMPEELSK